MGHCIGILPRNARRAAGAHARTGHPVAVASYLGSSAAFGNAIGDFAASYADQTERDYAGLVSAAGTGRITAVRRL